MPWVHCAEKRLILFCHGQILPLGSIRVNSTTQHTLLVARTVGSGQRTHNRPSLLSHLQWCPSSPKFLSVYGLETQTINILPAYQVTQNLESCVWGLDSHFLVDYLAWSREKCSFPSFFFNNLRDFFKSQFEIICSNKLIEDRLPMGYTPKKLLPDKHGFIKHP